MFNDERINFEMANLKKLIIIISGILAFLFLIFKLFVNYARRLDICLYLTEIIIVVASLVILIGSMTIKSDIKDELFVQRKQDYFNKAFKFLLYIGFISYAVVIPATIISGDNSVLSSNMSINMIMMSALFFGYGYLRLKKVYFNYNIIEEDSKIYYKNVFKNIWKITKFFGLIYLIAFCISIFYMFSNNPLIFIIDILIAFIVTVLSNSVYYLFISFLERMFYKEEHKMKITTPTVILLFIALIYLLLYIGINLIYYTIIKDGVLNDSSTLIASVSYIIKSVNEFLRFFIVLGIIFLNTDLFKNDKKLMKINSKLLILFIVFITYEIFWSRIEGGVNLAIREICYRIGSKGNHIDLYFKVASAIQTITILIKSVFYIILGILILIFNNKKIIEVKGLKLNFIVWLFLYLLIIIAYFMQHKDLLIISTYLGSGALSISLMIYLLVFYFKKSNKFSTIE